MTNGGESCGGGPDSKKPPEVIKTRIESWLKDAEEDADKAEKYLDKKKANIQRRESGSSFKRKQEHKLAAASSVAKQTDVLKALEVSWWYCLSNDNICGQNGYSVFFVIRCRWLRTPLLSQKSVRRPLPT